MATATRTRIRKANFSNSMVMLVQVGSADWKIIASHPAQSVEGLRLTATMWMQHAREDTCTGNRQEFVRQARKYWHQANSLDQLYRQYPEFLEIVNS